jgi:hypothetical protein
LGLSALFTRSIGGRQVHQIGIEDDRGLHFLLTYYFGTNRQHCQILSSRPSFTLEAQIHGQVFVKGFDS